jgi:hypothetical protein
MGNRDEAPGSGESSKTFRVTGSYGEHVLIGGFSNHVHKDAFDV